MSEGFVIEKGVPYNGHKNERGLPKTFRAMEIDDSVLLPEELRPYAYKVAKKVGIKIRTQMDDDYSVRVWRVE